LAETPPSFFAEDNSPLEDLKCHCTEEIELSPLGEIMSHWANSGSRSEVPHRITNTSLNDIARMNLSDLFLIATKEIPVFHGGARTGRNSR
jgi:hypothetical protein